MIVEMKLGNLRFLLKVSQLTAAVIFHSVYFSNRLMVHVWFFFLFCIILLLQLERLWGFEFRIQLLSNGYLQDHQLLFATLVNCGPVKLQFD